MEAASAEGFVLQPTYRIESGRAVVHLYGRLRNGSPFLLRDDRCRPHFYIESRCVEAARKHGASRILDSDRKTMKGIPVSRLEVPIPSATPALRNRLTRHGIRCYEANVRFAMRYLIDRGIRGALRMEGSARRQPRVGLVFENPRVEACDWMPDLSVLSLDIETDPKGSRILSIALAGPEVEEVLLWNPPGYHCPPGAVACADQRDLLERFCERIRRLDPDVLTGWNVIDFDLRVLDRMAGELEMELDLGRDPGGMKLRRSRTPWRKLEAIIPGRVVLDGIDVLRGSFVKLQNYTLESASREILGETKTIQGRGRGALIAEYFETHRQRLVDYNRTDAKLVIKILEKLDLVRLAARRSLLTGLPIDRVSASIAAFDFLYLQQLHQRKIVAPSVGSSDTTTTNPGGHVLDPAPGLYENVMVFDFKSLYPSLIRTFQIDPLGRLDSAEESKQAIVAPNGAVFARQSGILPELLTTLFPQREEARAKGDAVASYAIKILMNSFYGVLGTPACRFFQPQLAGAITTFGREILLWTKRRLEGCGLRVLYGDTDSLFVLSGKESPQAIKQQSEELVKRLNADLRDWIHRLWQVESCLELEVERLYRKLHLPQVRGGGQGARKRYAGLVGTGSQATVVFTGMEAVRRDWTELAKQVQRELYQRLFADRDLEGYLLDVVSRVRSGQMDSLLVYSKAIRKPLSAYRTTTPTHVAAARKLSGPPGRVVRYLITQAGPEPEIELSQPIDYEHYVQKQIRPVAEPILQLRGLEFDRVIGDERQLRLF